MRLAPKNPDLSYTQEELETAVKYLNLPTWSRAYVPCDDPSSEVSCSQTIEAYRTIKQWVDYITPIPLEQRDYVFTKHYFDGVGNRISIDTVVFLLALMSNRSMVVQGSFLKDGDTIPQGGNAYDYHPSIILEGPQIANILAEPSRNPHWVVPTFDHWFWTEYAPHFREKNTIELSILMYSTQLYTQHELADFATKHFGMHAVYYLSNFLVHLPERNFNTAKALFDSVPKTTRVLGIHLRFQFPGQFYSYSVENSINAVEPFLRAKLAECPTVLAFASDNGDMEKHFQKKFGDNWIKTNATRRPDFDHTSALSDVAMLMMCDECVLSYRSTFSFAVASRMGKRCWYAEKESPSVFQVSNSQATAVSMLMHHWDVNDWQTNRRFRVTHANERNMRYFIKYFVL